MNINNIKSKKFINNYTMRNNCILSFAVLVCDGSVFCFMRKIYC